MSTTKTTTKPYNKMLKDELLTVAQRLGLTNLSRLRKDEIIDLIIKASAKKEKSTTARRTKKPSSVPSRKKVTPSSTTAAPRTQAKVAGAGRVTLKSKRPTTKAPKASAEKSTANQPPTKPPTVQNRPDLSRPQAMGPLSDQSNAVVSKYSVTPPYRPLELQEIDESLADLPESYGDNRIVLLPRDISWLFAYWDLTEEYKEAARAAGGNALALRLYDVTGVDFDGTNAHATYEHECAEWARSWYIPTPTPDRDFIVEIGYRAIDQWFPLARSNKVAVPLDQPSTWIKDDFVSIRFEEDLREARTRLNPEPTAEHRAEQPPPMGPAMIMGPEQTILDDGEIRIVVGGTLLSPSGVPGSMFLAGSEQVGSWVTMTVPSSQAFVPGSQLFAPGSQVPGSQSLLPSSQAFLPASQSFLAGSQAFLAGSQAFLPGSQAFLPGSFGFLPSSPGFARPPIPLEMANPSAATDESDGTLPTQGAAHLVLDEPPLLLTTMEMVISGRSLPGTDLRIAGRSIPLGPDGCFSLRITVPEGLRELPIEAHCPQSSESRRILLRLGQESE